MSMKIGSFYFNSPIYKQFDHPVSIYTLDLLLDQHRGAVVDTVVSTELK